MTPLGYRHSEETLRLLSAIQKTRTHKPTSEATKLKISLANKGKGHPQSEESKRKISLARKNKSNLKLRKRFCIRNHDTRVVGRSKSGNCKQCLNDDLNNLYRGRPDVKVKAALRAKTPQNRFKTYQRNARNKGILFELTFEQFINFVRQECPYKCPQCTDTGIDRMDSTKGYTLDNCRPLCGNHNFLKTDFSQEEFIALCKAVVLRHTND